MSIFRVGIFMVKTEKQEAFRSLWQRFLKYQKENPEKFKELKSGYKLFTQMFGGMRGAYSMIVEFDSLADLEKYMTRMLEDEETKKIVQEFHLLIDPSTYSLNIWKTVKQVKKS